MRSPMGAGSRRPTEGTLTLMVAEEDGEDDPSSFTGEEAPDQMGGMPCWR